MPPSNVTPQFDVNPKERRLVEDRAKIRLELRQEYLKQMTNPHRHGEGGYLFDPALQRWQSMRAQNWFYFKKNPKTLLLPAFVLFTCFGYGHWFRVRREAKEARFRTGQVSYRDREFKFV